jgi:hypothetical protein
MAEFYMTLASNSSMDYYKENKTCNFTVQLPKTLTLDGKWKVAVAEVHHPNTFLNVAEGSDSILFRVRNRGRIFENFNKDCLEKFSIPTKTYKTIQEIIYAINFLFASFVNTEKKETESVYAFIYDESKNKVLPTEGAKRVFSEIFFNERLALILGYTPDQNVITHSEEFIRCSDLSNGIPNMMLIYCDLIEPVVFGDTLAKVLRIVNIEKNKSFGSSSHKEFEKIQYLPLLKKEFETISIELRDETGRFMPFEFGTVMVVLHFIKLN